MEKKAPLWVVILVSIILTTAFFTLSISAGVLSHSVLAYQAWMMLGGTALVWAMVLWPWFPYTWSYVGKITFSLGCWMIVCSWIITLFWYLPGGEKTMTAHIISGEIVKNFSAPDETVRFKESELELQLRLENGLLVKVRDVHPFLSVREQETYFQNVLAKRPKVYWMYKEPVSGLMMYQRFAYE